MCLLRCFLALAAFSGAALAQEDIDSCDHDDLASDYTTLLSVGHRKAVHPRYEPRELVSSHEAPSPPRREGGTGVANGIVFIKMIKVAGELFSSLVSQYAHKRGWRALQHKNCSEDHNPLGQATCQCQEHYIGPEDLPQPPQADHRYAALYTHMHYQPEVLQRYMVPDTVKLVLLRHPWSVLRSAHTMAAYQAVHENIQNNFCQSLAHDGDAWRAQCEFVQTGQDSLLDYLDHDANTRLRLLLAQGGTDVHEKAMEIVDHASKLLETFVVGLQEEFDASMLLFERAIGWSRDDSLYMKHTANAHSEYHKSHAAMVAYNSWGIWSPKGDEITNKLKRGVYLYHEILYNRGLEIHRKQIQSMLGTESRVASAVRKYRKQVDLFSTCMRKESRFNVCAYRGLLSHTQARPRCAKFARLKTFLKRRS